jgi:hypothetical protein
VSGAQSYAQLVMPEYGWSVSSQWSYLNQVWQWESSWEWNIGYGGCHYPSCNLNDAYGIPQADPGTKMASVASNGGSDWETDGLTQVQWGLEYIKTRYGSPYQAYLQETSCGKPPCGYVVGQAPTVSTTTTVPSSSFSTTTTVPGNVSPTPTPTP